MNNYETSDEKYTFNEEVPESELYDKSDVDDLIYVKDVNYKRKISTLIIIAAVLIICSLLLCLFGLLFYNTNSEDIVEENVIQYDLFVTHSNNYYGRSGISFKEYPTQDKALNYTLKIENNNPVDLKYKMIFTNPNFGEDNVDMGFINYQLLIDNSEQSSGSLTNVESFNLFENNIKKNTIQNVTLKLWSDKVDSKNKFNFKINVES